jgi:NAD-dependent SIR2 family protein deacetylase
MREIAKATSAYKLFKNAAQNDHPRAGDLHHTMSQSHLSEAKRARAGADALLITAGAGMGVDSGLPDFRGNEGFWKAYPALGRLKKSFTEMANPAAFSRTPRAAWAFYGHRLGLYRGTKPHNGFARLLEFGSRLNGGVFVFTSNVDGHFQKSGFDHDRIVECHGSIHHLQCTLPCSNAIWSAEHTEIVIDDTAFEATGVLPTCPDCGSLARPNILMFGDSAWIAARTEAQESCFSKWLGGLSETRAKVVVMEFGAGLSVPTVRTTSERISRSLGGVLLRINPREPQTPPGGHGFTMGALEGVRTLIPEK